MLGGVLGWLRGSGNWYAHAVVDAGWDIKTGFPFDQVEDGFYANVPAPVRELCRKLRDIAAAYGFGRTEFLPIKSPGPSCARYLTKYLGKAFSTEKAEGEEKRRLFGVWGGVRFVHSQFSFVSSRILRRKLAWLADELRIADYDGFKALYGRHWWHFIGSALREVILPEDDYKVLVNGEAGPGRHRFPGVQPGHIEILRFTGRQDDAVAVLPVSRCWQAPVRTARAFSGYAFRFWHGRSETPGCARDAITKKPAFRFLIARLFIR